MIKMYLKTDVVIEAPALNVGKYCDGTSKVTDDCFLSHLSQITIHNLGLKMWVA
jgi:hypothetical protein